VSYVIMFVALFDGLYFYVISQMVVLCDCW